METNNTITKRINLFLKRAIDLLGSIIGGILISPLLFTIAIVIKLASKGPILFTQDRIGKKGEVFKILKFRTMVIDAENMGDGLRVKSENDLRITPIGKILRNTSMDELPQLFNVILGQMSLVGPRPPATYHPYNGYENYPDWAKKRFEMRPGMTGLAQVTVRNSVTWDERIKADLKYIKEFSIQLDFKILLYTFIKVLNRSNIYSMKFNEKFESFEEVVEK